MLSNLESIWDLCDSLFAGVVIDRRKHYLFNFYLNCILLCSLNVNLEKFAHEFFIFGLHFKVNGVHCTQKLSRWISTFIQRIAQRYAFAHKTGEPTSWFSLIASFSDDLWRAEFGGVGPQNLHKLDDVKIETKPPDGTPQEALSWWAIQTLIAKPICYLFHQLTSC